MLKNKTDIELILAVKQQPKKCTLELRELIKRHSGIFVDMVSKLVVRSNTFCNKPEILEEKDYCIYDSIMTFDESRGVKFSTHLANKTKWLCLRAYNKTKGRVILPSSNLQFDFDLSHLKDDGPIKNISKKDAFSYATKIISKLPDKRAIKILRMRYIQGKGNKLMPWREISEEIGLSKQACIDIHNKTLIKLRNKIKTC